MAFAKVSEPFEFNQLSTSQSDIFQMFLGPLKEDLEALEQNLPELIQTNSQTSKEILDYFFLQKGKRIRPAIFLFLCKSFSYTGSHKQSMACVSEYVHAASLLHDDVIDHSPTRRGKKTAHTIWGEESSILVGDLIYSQASEIMTRTGELGIVSAFAKAISCMSEGEIIQLENIFNLNLSEEIYYKIISFKTGSLLSATCKTAAILSGLNREETETLESFGATLGLSFQLLDDALDYRNSQEVLGKKQFKDLEEGKVTLPLILAKKQSSPLERSKLEKIFSTKEMLPEDKTFIVSLVKKYKTAEESIQIATEKTKEAIVELSRVFAGKNELDSLKALALGLTQRTH